MKTRVFKYPDGTVCYSTPSEKYQNEVNFGGCKFPEYCDGLPFIDVDRAALPPSDSKTGDYHEMIYFDGNCSLANLKQDKPWEVCLMPTFMIRRKYIDYLNKKIRDELLAVSPDAIALAKDQSDLATCSALKPGKHDKEIYQIALDGLARSGKDTTVIRAKLEAKINE